MPTFIILLRGVNVGKAKRVPMADFKSLLAEIGFASPKTLLNSGNAVAQAPKQSPERLAAKVSSALEAAFGFDVPVVVKTADELGRIVAGNALAREASDHSRLLVAFTQDNKVLAQLNPLKELAAPPEKFHLGKDAAYLHCANGILDSKAAVAMLGKMGKGVTTRNWATVLKLQALVAAAAP